MKFIRVSEMDSYVLSPITFHLEHYIPTEGIVLLYGKWSSYKTPVTIEMNKALLTGTDLWGLNVPNKIPTLYIEADMAESLAMERFKKHTWWDGKSENGDFLHCYPGFDLVNPNSSTESSDTYSALQAAHKKYGYKVVFLDSLRCIHNLPDEQSATVNRVYHGLARLFPKATVVIIHHNRKEKPENFTLTDESQDALNAEAFAGSQAWANHAVVAMRLKVTNKEKHELYIQHTKSQIGELQPNLRLKVYDGMHCVPMAANPSDVSTFLKTLKGSHTAGELDRLIAKHFGVSERTARTKRLLTGVGNLGKTLGNESALE